LAITTQSAGGVVQVAVLGAASTSNTATRFSPALLGIADVGLLDLGEIFAQYRFTNIKLVYRTAAGTQNGSFVMALSDDPDDPSSSGTFANTAANLDMFRCKRHISVWKDGYLSWRPKDTNKWYYTAGGDAAVTDADIRLNSQVAFYWSTDGGGVAAADGNMGSILLEYVVQFRARRPSYSSLTVPHSLMVSSSVQKNEDVDEAFTHVDGKQDNVTITRTEYLALLASRSK